METGFINYVAETVAKGIGMDIVPVFARWTEHRGYAKRQYYSKQNVFTLPKWLQEENKFFQMAYIAHEVCHHAKFTRHDATFYENERKALALFDLEPHYQYGMRYADMLLIEGTNVVVWSKSTAKTKTTNSRFTSGEGRW